MDISGENTRPLGLGGLLNMGNTCYANATIQAFRNCTKIPWIFEGGRYDRLFKKEPKGERQKQQALTQSFADVVTLLGRCRKGQSVRPSDFWSKFRVAVHDTGFEHLAAREPHDSHEFYLFLLDTLHESMAQEVTMRITKPPPQTDTERRAITALETWKREFEKKYSPLVDLFYGLTHIITRCKACGHESHRWEIFSALKAHVPQVIKDGKAPTLMEMFEEEFKPEPIEGYACDKCTPTRTDAERITRIWRLPMHLIVVLKRFTPDGRKIQTPMAVLPTEEPFSFAPFFSEESPERTAETRFRLHSIVDHHGVTGGGHYTAQVLSQSDTTWRIYDDESSSTIGGGETPMFGSSTYMLWFTRDAAAGNGTPLKAPEA